MMEARTEKAEKMKEIDWTAAPTVYQYAVEGSNPPIVDRRPVPTGIASGLKSAAMRCSAMSSVMKALDMVFTHDPACRPGLDASVTRMVVEIDYARAYGPCRYLLHLLTWNDVRVTIEIRHEPTAGNWGHAAYAVGVRHPGREWSWSPDGLPSHSMQQATRRDTLAITENTQ